LRPSEIDGLDSGDGADRSGDGARIARDTYGYSLGSRRDAVALEFKMARRARDPAAGANGGEDVGRFSVACELSNYEEVKWAAGGFIPPEQVHRATISGVVDSGAARLVLPPAAVAQLGLTPTGRTTVRFADGRREPRDTVSDVQFEYAGRSGVFSAVVEPGRSDALIGAIVLEELDLLPDCTNGVLLPRDPNSTITEVE
jgi:predicted aspartyl protease